MNYWKYVDAGNYEVYAAKLYDKFVNENETFFVPREPYSFWNPLNNAGKEQLRADIPELDYLSDTYGPINEVALLVLYSDSSTIHTDHTVGRNAGVKARLNIPVLNCAGTTTAFYDFTGPDMANHVTNPGGTKIWPAEFRTTKTPVSTVELCKPAILRTSAPHTVFCTNDQFPRVSMTVSFKTDLVHLLDQ